MAGKRKIAEMWVFFPDAADLKKEWTAPDNYVRASFGELRLRPATDTPLDDPMFEPGWKRMAKLNQEYLVH